MSKRLTVPKTYKLFIGGAFPRSESGRTYEVVSAEGRVPRERRAGLAEGRPGCRRRGTRQPSRAGRARPPTTAARCSTASPRCSRAAGRSSSTRSSSSPALSAAVAQAEVDEAIDRWVWYAGWCDKFAQVAGNGNPVAGPYFNISVPEPTGVVGVIAPQDTALLGLVSAIAPALVTGNAVVAVASQRYPLSAISLAEVIATSDVPGRRRQHPHRLARRDRSVARLAPRGARARPRRRGRPRLGGPADRGGRDAHPRPSPRAGDGCRGPEPGAHRRVHRDQDRLAPEEPRLTRGRLRHPGHSITGRVTKG